MRQIIVILGERALHIDMDNRDHLAGLALHLVNHFGSLPVGALSEALINATNAEHSRLAQQPTRFFGT